MKPLWETLSANDRIQLLTIPLEELRSYAKQQAARAKAVADAEAAEALLAGNIVITLEPPVDKVLETGLERSKERGTWKIWRWPSSEEEESDEMKEFYDSETFRKHLEEFVLPEELRAGIPKEEEGVKAVETPAEAGLRQRMTDLLARVSEQRALQEENAFNRRAQRRHDATAAVRDANIDLIAMMLGAVECEHEALYNHVLHPITSMMCEILPEGARKTTLDELHFEDLEHLLPDDIVIIHDWLTEKIDALTTKLKPDHKDLEEEDAEEEPIGDVDLFTLVEDGNAMRVNEKWLTHLQSRVLGEDGQPRRAKQDEDPFAMGLVLEWIYGTIVSTAEKARDGAHRVLGGKLSSVQQAMDFFTSALEEQVMWEKKADKAKEIMEEMQESREQLSQLAEEYDMRTGAACLNSGGDIDDSSGGGESDKNRCDGAAATGDLPPEIIIFMLKREALLTDARIHFLVIEQFQAQRVLRSVKSQLLQGEPQFERLKKELEELKAAPTRSLDGTYRSSAELERARKQHSDASIEDQIQVQANFRETGLRLQKLVDKKKEIEVGLGRREQEIAQLSTWKGTVSKLAMTIEASLASSASLDAVMEDIDEEKGDISKEEMALLAAVKSATGYGNDLASCCAHFQKDVRQQLYTDADDVAHFDKVKSQLSEIDERVEEGKVAIQLLKSFVINVACDDPGTTLGVQLLLPFLQEKLDAKALEHAAKLAAAAEDEILKMELESADRQRQEKEKKAKAKLKAKEKARMDKERERADLEAKEREAKLKEEEEARQREEEQEIERRCRQEELQRLRQLEEEAMERRRQELLEQEGSYWNQRLGEQDFIAAQAQLEQELMRHAMEHSNDGNEDDNDQDGFVIAGSQGQKSRREREHAKDKGGKGKSRKRSSKNKQHGNQAEGEQQQLRRDSPRAAELQQQPLPVPEKQGTPTPTLASTAPATPPESVANDAAAPTPDTPPAADSSAATVAVPVLHHSHSLEDAKSEQPHSSSASIHSSPIKPSTASTPHGSPAALASPPPTHPSMPPHGVPLPNGVVLPPMPLPVPHGGQMMMPPMPMPHHPGVMAPPPHGMPQNHPSLNGNGGAEDGDDSRSSSMSSDESQQQQQQHGPPMHPPPLPYPTVVGNFHHPNGMYPVMYYPPHPHHSHHHHHHHHAAHQHHRHPAQGGGANPGVVPPPPPPSTPPPHMQHSLSSSTAAAAYPVMPPPPPPPPPMQSHHAMHYSMPGVVPPPAPPRRPRQAHSMLAKQLRADACAFVPSSNPAAAAARGDIGDIGDGASTRGNTKESTGSPRGILERSKGTADGVGEAGIDSESNSGKSTSSESGSLVPLQEERACVVDDAKQ